MKMSKVLGVSARVYREKFGEGALCVLLQIVLRLMVAAPLLALVTTEVPWVALFSIPLYLLIVPVARQNMAEAMQDAIAGGPLFSVKLVSCENYAQKFLRGLKQALLMLLWAALFIAATCAVLWAYAGKVDAFTLIRLLMQLGGGSSMNGIKLVLMIYAATLLPIVLGCAFHSGTRHALALGNKGIIKGHRLGVVAVWFAGLVALVPFFAAVAYVGMDVVSSLINVLSTLNFDNLSLPSLGEKIYLLAAAFVVLLIPALPFKQLMTAVYVRGLKE